MAQPAPPCTFVIFGAAGDLTLKLLMPAVYDLAVAGMLDPQTRILGADHNDRDDAAWRKELDGAVRAYARSKNAEFARDAWDAVSRRCAYQHLDFTRPEDFQALAERLAGAKNVVFYLAASPAFFGPIATGLANAGLLKETPESFPRIAIEKPFGRDASSAHDLNAELDALAKQPQIFRVDHFLGKEAVQGIAVLRFANRALEPLLDRRAVANVQITAAETLGIEERGKFYDVTGALRDMVPNHLLSLLTAIAMEEPMTFDGDRVRDAKMALLESVVPATPGDAARGRYAAGTIAGQAVRAYLDEENVARDSRTETYAALALRVDNARWRDVPFFLRTGKRLSGHVTTIAVTLQPPKNDYPAAAPSPETLVLGIDPERGVLHRFAAKRPGVDVSAGDASVAFDYTTAFDEPPNTGYETLLYHILRGDQTHFQRADMIEREWAIVDPVTSAWSDDRDAPEEYAAGGNGPASSDALLAKRGGRWLDIVPPSKMFG